MYITEQIDCSESVFSEHKCTSVNMMNAHEYTWIKLGAHSLVFVYYHSYYTSSFNKAFDKVFI